MLAKYWKKIGLVILIIACTINIMYKLVNKVSLNTELKATVQYMYNEYKQENKK